MTDTLREEIVRIIDATVEKSCPEFLHATGSRIRKLYLERIADAILSTLTPAPEAGWRDMDSAPKDGIVFVGLFDNDDVIACRYLDNSKARFPWAGFRPMYGAETPGRKLIGWQPMPAPGEPATEQPSDPMAGTCIHMTAEMAENCPTCNPTLRHPLATEQPSVKEAAVDALASYQQADEDGIMVLVSRQAIEECLPALRSLAGDE